MGRLAVLRYLFTSGRLALRLFQDPRVPLYPKLLLGGVLLYLFSPVDVIPDWIPILGALDDVAVLAAGIALFVRLCPPELVAEHESGKAPQSGQPGRKTVEGTARPVRPAGEEGPSPTGGTSCEGLRPYS